jgi:4-hydroxy-tetrahydrodipicolinate synthase
MPMSSSDATRSAVESPETMSPHDASATRLRGVIAAIPTPLAGQDPDHDRLVSLARHLLASGCHGLNLLGTTGEATSFSTAQRMAVMSAVAHAGLPLGQMMVGTGAAAVHDAVTLSHHAAGLGYAGILLLPPFYYKGVSDEGVIEYVGRVIEAIADSAVAVYLYNFPALSGVAYGRPLVERLLERFGRRIAGVKDSSANLPYAREIAALGLDVFPSSEEYLMEAWSGPFAGCISATANISSRESRAVFDQGDAAALTRATALRHLFDGLPLIAGVKYLLSELHADESLSRVMPPLTALTPAQASTVRERYASLR